MNVKKKIWRKIAIVLSFCLLVCGIPWGSMEVVYAQDATVYKIYATMPAQDTTGEPSEFEIADTPPNGKELFALFIDGGDYTMTEEDNEIVIWANNANITAGLYLPCEFRLSGNSTINFGSYTVSSKSEDFPAFDKSTPENLTVANLNAFYHSETYMGNGQQGENWVGPKPYSYRVTANTTWSDCLEIDELTVNTDAALTITGGNGPDENNTSNTCYWAGAINVQKATVFGSINIQASDEKYNEPNLLAIEGGGSLAVSGSGSITGTGDARLEIREHATVTGLTLYESYDKSNLTGVAYACNGTQNWADFIYDEQSKQWVFPPADQSGIRIDTRGATVMYQLGALAFNSLPEGNMIPGNTLESASKVTFQITPSDNQNIRGIRVREWKAGEEKLSYQSFAESTAPYSFTLIKDGDAWADYELEIIDRDVLFDNQYRIIRCGSGDLTLQVNDVNANWDAWDSPTHSFTAGTQIKFTITGNVYKVFVQQNDQAEKELTGTNGVYTFTPDKALGFEVLVYTSKDQYDFDHCQPGEGADEFSVEYQVCNDENNAQNNVTYNVSPIQAASCDGRTKLILANTVTEVRLTIAMAAGFSYEICDHDTYCNSNDCASCDHCIALTNTAKANQNVYVWQVRADDGNNTCPEIRFFSVQDNPGEDNPDGNNPGGDHQPQDPAEKVTNIIENQRYAFGDWDDDNDVDADDLKLGMACQIFYPEFNDSGRNQDIRYAYGITTYNHLLDKITITEDTGKNLTATDASGVAQTIPAYQYEITINPVGETSAESVHASGTVYAFSFLSGSKYGQNSRGCVIAVTKKNGVEKYHLRMASGSDADMVSPVTGDSEDSAILVVDDFDVVFDTARGEYRRDVSIFGNGASLDALLSQEEDAGLVAYQGRNEDFIRDVNSALKKSWANIFGIFTFCQKNFAGVRVKGSGADGNTPSWAFNQYPVYSTASASTSNNAAVVYFGNRTVTIEPVTALSGVNKQVTGIQSVTSVDSIPEEAVKFTKSTDTKWVAEFKSDYYDNVKIKVVYTLSNGSTFDSYITIHRVGIDILCGSPGGGATSMTLFHGTENGPSYTPTNKQNFVIWGTYYYPTPEDGNNLVDLYVTYTWKDGSVTRQTIKNKEALNLAYHHDNTSDCQSSDFILYDGTQQNAPVKIAAIAVASGFENSTTFSGAKFGAGKGVVWNNYSGDGR